MSFFFIHPSSFFTSSLKIFKNWQQEWFFVYVACLLGKVQRTNYFNLYSSSLTNVYPMTNNSNNQNLFANFSWLLCYANL